MDRVPNMVPTNYGRDNCHLYTDNMDWIVLQSINYTAKSWPLYNLDSFVTTMLSKNLEVLNDLQQRASAWQNRLRLSVI